VALDYQKIYYSGVRAIANSSANQAPLGSDAGPGFGWQDIGVVKLGVQWQYDSNLTLRAGYNHGQNPIRSADVSFNILAPGVVQDHFTLGFTKQLDKTSELSGMFMYAKKSTVSGPSMFNGSAFSGMNLSTGLISESISMNQKSFGIQYGRKF
jgi:long-chain fatty acid transport protein